MSLPQCIGGVRWVSQWICPTDMPTGPVLIAGVWRWGTSIICSSGMEGPAAWAGLS